MTFHGARKPREKNPPPPSSIPEKSLKDSEKSRKIRNVTNEADYAELERSYTFVPEEKNTSSPLSKTTWQERMVSHYHSHLYKEYVLADLRRPGQVGMRWRTRAEVEQGKGHETCGNKHCLVYDRCDLGGRQRSGTDFAPREENQKRLAAYYRTSPLTEPKERCLLEQLPEGLGLHDYEVNFAYEERNVKKNELVKLRLCLRCAPLLFQTKGTDRALQARRCRETKYRNNEESYTSKTQSKHSRPDEGRSTSISEDATGTSNRALGKQTSRKCRTKNSERSSDSTRSDDSRAHRSEKAAVAVGSATSRKRQKNE